MKVGRVPVAALLAVGILVGIPVVSLARSGHLSTWQGKYPGSTSDNTAGCDLCHGGSNNTWNPYGWAMRQQWVSNGGDISAAIDAVEGLDSDSDPTGSSNLAEINANTQPGWTSGDNNTIYAKDGTATPNQSPPSGIGALDPVVAGPDIDVSPTSLDFGTVVVGSNRTMSVTVANVGSADLTVSSLGVSGSSDFALGPGAPSTPFVVAAGGDTSVPVRYTPSGAGSDAGTLTIGSNDPDESSVQVSLSGTGSVVAEPDIDVSPTSLDFGTVVVGSNRTMSVTVANVGSADLTVSSLGVSGSSDFALGPGAPSTPFVVAAGGDTSVPVRYTPSGAGSDAGTLTIGSNDPDESSVQVSLSGTGGTTSAIPKIGDPVGTNISPHGGYGSTSSYCLQCHGVHAAQGAYALMWKSSVTETCKTCHGYMGAAPTGTRTPVKRPSASVGTTSLRTVYDVLAPAGGHGIGTQFVPGEGGLEITASDWSYGAWRGSPWAPPGGDATTPAGVGTSSDTGGGLYCASCHTPHADHGQAANTKKLWTRVDGDSPRTLVNWENDARVWPPGGSPYTPRYLWWSAADNAWKLCTATGGGGTCTFATVSDAEGQTVSLYGYKLLSTFPNHTYSTFQSYGTDYRGRDKANWCSACHASKLDTAFGGTVHNHPTACTTCHGNPSATSGATLTYDFPHTSSIGKLLIDYPDALCVNCHVAGSLP